MNKIYKIMIVTGEASGDAHAAKLVKAICAGAPQIKFEFFGATSHKLRVAEVETIVNSDEFSIVGLAEIGRALPMFWKAFQKLKQAAIDRNPDVVILVDFPDFNLKLAKSLKKRGLKIIYYISPQLWAWRKYRVKTIKSSVDLVLTILPFEKTWYQENGVSHIEYVGNPLVKEVSSKLSKDEFCFKYNLDPTQPIVALLAGSRHKEIVRILPVMLETAIFMAQKKPEIQFVIALAKSRKVSEIENSKTKLSGLPKNLLVVQDETYEVLNASDAAAVTSGTATLETAILGTPMAIVYKTSKLNYKLLRPLISVEHFGLINLIAQERLVKEFIQDEFTVETLSAELFNLLEKEKNQEIRQKLKVIVDKLGHGGASKRAANFILDQLEIEHAK